jgi:hypothetical protein
MALILQHHFARRVSRPAVHMPYIAAGGNCRAVGQETHRARG